MNKKLTDLTNQIGKELMNKTTNPTETYVILSRLVIAFFYSVRLNYPEEFPINEDVLRGIFTIWTKEIMKDE